MSVKDVEDSLGLSVCKKQSLVIERGQGVWVWDVSGEKYLDFTAGWGVTCLGHSHPLILGAIQDQAARIIQNPNSGFTYSPARASLLLELQKVLPAQLSRMFFANSGAEANDAALKLARKITGRSKVVSLSGSFHGRTLATLSVSGGPQNGARYLPRVPGQAFSSHNNFNELDGVVDGTVAAVIVELIQGEGGVRLLDKAFVKHLRTLCDIHQCLLIVDEVQTGFCRTGWFFATEYYDVVPDILTMGKGIAGGLPFAAMVMTEKLAAAVELGDHGGTYCGNPLSCAVAAQVTRFLRENNVVSHVADLGALALTDLLQLKIAFPDVVKDVRGLGLMLAIELQHDSEVWPLTDECQRAGLLVTPTRNAVIRLLPSLLLTKEEWRAGFEQLTRAMAAFVAGCERHTPALVCGQN
ncbi:aspartate aminotransferase family protein [Gammaproteobacteria bacterium LSUCC0112]|nr:aspartate aminotransferase family protein [Gammaproteobacteria bacterium LSUCC0112]